jgi:hypothetical protein
MATVSGTVRVPRIGAAKSKRYKLTKVSGTITKGGRITFKPKLSSAARKAIKQALRRGRRITVDLKVTVADRIGNTTTLARKIRLRL